jgi:uncharacterized protein (DUF302 family)
MSVKRLKSIHRCSAVLLSGWLLLAWTNMNIQAGEKSQTLRNGGTSLKETGQKRFLYPKMDSKQGQQTSIGAGTNRVPVIIVSGTPYEMGHQLGILIGDQMRAFVPAAMAGICQELHMSIEDLREIWARTSAYTDDRLEQELAGLADGADMPLHLLQAMHAVPLMMPYSCSSIAAWGRATEDGHLYQTRNLDWSLEVGAHNVPVIVVYRPKDGVPHVVPTFAGMIGAHTGMNARGIALSEMGDAPAREMPYQVHAPHFTTFFRTLLYDADSLGSALRIFKEQPLTKRYHYVFGDGQGEKRAVKIRAHSPEAIPQQIKVWHDNDPTDEFAPDVLPCVVYNDEGRGAFPILKATYGKLNGPQLVDLANRIPIKGGNVMNVVYDATALKLWVSYAKGGQEAYERPYVFLDLKPLLVKPGSQAPKTVGVETMRAIIESSQSPEQVLEAIKTAAPKHKFGILNVHDLRQTLDKKGFPIPNACFVLDVCNPMYAQKVLGEDIGMAVALPCRIAIYEEAGLTKIATIKPTAVLAGLNTSPALAAIAEEVEKAMIAIMEEAK